MDNNCLLSRQPIYRSKADVAAYEVLSHRVFESADKANANADDTARVIFSMFTDAGLDHIVGEHPGYVSLPSSALTEGLWRAVPKSRVVLGYFEDFKPSDLVSGQLSELVGEGYRIALSGQLCKESLDLLGDFADVVKIDVTKYLPVELEQRVKELKRYKSKILGGGIDTYDDLEFCKSLGLDLYQGNFLCRPAAKKKEMPVSRVAMMRVLSKLQNPDIKTSELDSLISQDLGLSYRLLRYVNSAAVSLPREVESVGHAIRMVGTNLLRTWASVLLLSSVDDKPRELMTIALVRAHMCERLAQSIKSENKESFLFAGLLSVLDAILDCPMEQALAELPVSPEIKAALIHRAGPIGQALRCTIAYEQADWEEVQFYGLSPAPIRENYIAALAWARQLTGGLAASSAAG